MRMQEHRYVFYFELSISLTNGVVCSSKTKLRSILLFIHLHLTIYRNYNLKAIQKHLDLYN